MVAGLTYIGQRHDQYETVAGESCPLFRVLRHRTPSSPIYLSEVIRFSLRLITRIPLIQRREKHRSCEEKAPPRSGFSLSMYVVLKTRYVNPNIHVRRFIAHARSPNLSTTRPQLYPYAEQRPNIGSPRDQYRFTQGGRSGSLSIGMSEGGDIL